MLLLPLAALAQELPWECAAISTPADARPYVDAVREETSGIQEAGEAALAIAEAWVDASCLTDCSDSSLDTCSAGACTTSTGAWVEYEETLRDDTDGTLSASSGVTTIVVEPPASAGATWTRLSVTKTWSRRRERAGTIMPHSERAAWDVSWEGTLDPAWVPDGAFTASLYENTYTDTSRYATWDDGSCAWSVDDVSSATVGGTEVAVSYAWDRCSGSFFSSADATLDGAPYGVVDPYTWEDAADADDDGNNDGYYDCDDTDPAVYYCAVEVPYDGVDQDCDGVDATAPDEDTGGPTDTGDTDTGDTDTGDTDTGATDTGDTDTADTDTADTDTADTGAETGDTADTGHTGETGETGDTGDTAPDDTDTGGTDTATETGGTDTADTDTAEDPDAPKVDDEAPRGCATVPASPGLAAVVLLALGLRRRRA